MINRQKPVTTLDLDDYQVKLYSDGPIIRADFHRRTNSRRSVIREREFYRLYNMSGHDDPINQVKAYIVNDFRKPQ